MQQTNQEFNSILVIGGEGFLGHHLVLALIKQYPNSTIWSLDLIQRYFDSNPFLPTTEKEETIKLKHKFIQANLTNIESLLEAFQQAQPQVVFHTASPWTGSSFEICQQVNVHGTINTINASHSVHVKRLIYTSSAGVVFNGNHLINVDERLPIPKIGCDHYNITKAKAEAIVLEANGKNSLLTCAIRPAGIFGPGDRQAVPGMIQVLKNRQDWIQIGNNKNLFDWTYVDNVVHAHLLALEKLEEKVPFTAFENSLNPIFKTIIRRNLLTSTTGKIRKSNSSNGCGGDEDSNLTGEESIENIELIDLSDEIHHDNTNNQISSSNPGDHTSWINGNEHLIDLPLPAKRHRWDQWAPISTQINYPNQFVPVAGEAFFITGGEPIFFWDFARSIWHEYSIKNNLNLKIKRKKLIIPSFLALFLAFLAQIYSKIFNKKSLFTPEKVRYTCVSKYHNIEKARVVLGYEPVVGVEEGIQRAVKWYILNESINPSTASDKKND